MKDLNKISNELFSKIRGRFKEVTIGDEDATPTNDPMSARFFDFPFAANDKSLGQVSISVSEDEITVIYSNELVTNEDELTKKSWYDFLKELRQFARKRLLNFDTRNINKSNLNKRDYKFLARKSGDNNMNETKLYGTSRISYQKIGEARIMIKHTESVNQESATGRTQKIGKIYIESADGERFRYPFKHLSGARAMARHVSEGGNAYDDFGKHIVGLSEEMAKLRKFKNYMGRSAVMAESLAGYTDIVKERIATVKKTIESLQKPVYYKETFEAFESPVLEDVPSDVAENWIDELTIKQFNEELADVFPYIYKLIGEATKAKSIGPEELEEKMTKLQASKYTCEDCGCQMHNCKPDCDCKHDSHDETGSWWKDENGNGIPDVMEGSGLKTKEEIELEAAFEETMGQFSDNVCEECGNLNWSNVSEEKKKGSHGKVCWKGYRRGKGDSCHRMGETNEAQEGQTGTMALFVADQDGGEHEVEVEVTIKNGKPEIDPRTLPGPEDQLYWDEADIEQQAMDAMRDGDIEFDEGNTNEGIDPKSALDAIMKKDPGDEGIGYVFDKFASRMSDEDADELAKKLAEFYPEWYEQHYQDEGNAYAHAVKKAKMNGKKKGDEIDGPDGDKIKLEKDEKTPLGEFILSYFDRDNGVFPKGETAVLTMVEKDYGEQFIDPAKAFIEQITAKFDEWQMQSQPQQMETDHEYDRIRELAGLR